MAGWKLRKDKAQADAPDTSEDPSENLSEKLSEDLPVPGWDTPAAAGADETFLPATAEPTFETDDLDTAFDSTAFGSNGFAPIDFQDTDSFEDTEALHTGGVIALGGDSEPLVIAPQPDFERGEEVSFDDDVDDDAPSGAVIYEAPEAEAPMAYAPPPPLVEAAPPVDDAADGPEANIPEVAPFVMDTLPAAPASSLPHRLVMRVGRLSAAFEVTKEVTVIGRPDSALHFYPDIEVETDDAVSRRHAEVLKSGDGQYYLLDSGSTNGTRLNGETLPPNEERLLAHGDRIHIGERTEIIFE